MPDADPLPTPARDRWAPTVSPGQTRDRSSDLLIRNPLNGIPTVEVYQQQVIRTDKMVEEHHAQLETFSFQVTNLAHAVPWRSPVDDHLLEPEELAALLSGPCTDALTLTAIYSRVRDEQLARAVQAAPTP